MIKRKARNAGLELAEIVGWSPSTVYRKAVSGKIPGCLNLDGSVRFKESKIREWIEVSQKEVQGRP
jgi:predicted DNA-binding transcriptional regulator AlpA